MLKESVVKVILLNYANSLPNYTSTSSLIIYKIFTMEKIVA